VRSTAKNFISDLLSGLSFTALHFVVDRG